MKLGNVVKAQLLQQTTRAAKLRSPTGRALVLAPFHHEALNTLGNLMPVTYESWTDTRRLYSPEELVERINSEDVEVLVVEADFVFEEVFEHASCLRFLGVCRGNPNQVDLLAATSQGIVVVNTPGRNARAVAELTLGLLIALARAIPSSHHYVTGGFWENPVDPYISLRGIELHGKTLGLIGLGAIGRLVARLCKGLGMRVIAYDPYLGPSGEKKGGTLLTSLEDLLREVDFLSIHAPLTPDTQSLLNRERLLKMKRGAYIVNTAAYGILEEGTLVELLGSGHIAGVALDVHEAHPVPPSCPLLGMPKVILTPHIGGATNETVERHSWMIVEDLRRFLDGRQPKHLANPQVWARRG